MKYSSLIKHQLVSVFILLLSIQYASAQQAASSKSDTENTSFSSSITTSDTSSTETANELISIGYSTQSRTAINTAIATIEAPAFNQGLISDPTQLIQGKTAGLQIYNRGGDPNRASLLRVRGTALGVNTSPLIVVDDIIGASLQTIDPNDVARITVLKGAAATAIYGARASAGALLIETKRASDQKSGLQINYLGQGAISQVQATVPVMSPDEFLAVGGVDLGASTNWINEITQTAFSQTHGLSIGQTINNSNFRLSANYRDVEGILLNSGFEQLNARLNFDTKVLNDRLTVGLNVAYSHRATNYSFAEAFQYAIQRNPTAPVLGEDAPFAFNSEQYGGYYETLGFNPVSILEQNRNEELANDYLLGAYASYQLSDEFKFTGRFAYEHLDRKNRDYYPTTALFRGNAASPIRKGRVDYLGVTSKTKLYEGFLTFERNQEQKAVQLSVGYSRQSFSKPNYGGVFSDFSVGNYDFLASFLPPFDPLFSNTPSDILTNFPGLESVFVDRGLEENLNALFARALFDWKQTFFLNASLRSEKSDQSTVNLIRNTFAALSIGADINQYLSIAALDQLKIRAGWGMVAPNKSKEEIRGIIAAATVSIPPGTLIRSPVIDYLRTQRQAEFNLGLDIASKRFYASIDAYSRRATDVWEKVVDSEVFGVERSSNDTQASTRGIELNLGFELIGSEKISWQTMLWASSYKIVLEDDFQDASLYGTLGVSGQNGVNTQRRAIGEALGQIWGPVFTGINEMGEPIFADLNGDGVVNVNFANALETNADFQVLGKGLPAVELGWGHQINTGNWSLNVFFRSALGHSLVNTFRLAQEPYITTQSVYNFVNSSLREPTLMDTHFSSLYVERADFLKLDNLTISKRIPLKGDHKNLSLSLSGQNLWVWTNYTGADPEPVLVDYGRTDNAVSIDYSDYNAATSGIDRRYSYWPSRTFVLGLKLDL